MRLWPCSSGWPCGPGQVRSQSPTQKSNCRNSDALQGFAGLVCASTMPPNSTKKQTPLTILIFPPLNVSESSREPKRRHVACDDSALPCDEYPSQGTDYVTYWGASLVVPSTAPSREADSHGAPAVLVPEVLRDAHLVEALAPALFLLDGTSS